jgi:hypothetical protein
MSPPKESKGNPTVRRSGRLSAVDSKPASDGRIKTSHFFRLNPAEMFWQGMI